MSVHSVMECEESKLARALRVRDRFTLAQRVGQRMANTRAVDDAAWALINSLYRALSQRDQLSARHEAAMCRAAKRGEHVAMVAA